MKPDKWARLIFVDCEAGKDGRKLTQFGAVHYTTRESFHGFVDDDSDCVTCGHAKSDHIQYEGACRPGYECQAGCTWYRSKTKQMIFDFGAWLKAHVGNERPLFVSDNPVYDWPPIHYLFLDHVGENPFGHSARRISDFYAGLNNDFWSSTRWKHLRITPHDHHPVHDAMGNLEAFERIMKGER